MEIDNERIKKVEEKASIVIDNPTNKQILENADETYRISYIGVDGKYRTGGFIKAVNRNGSSITYQNSMGYVLVQTSNIQTIFLTEYNKDGRQRKSK